MKVLHLEIEPFNRCERFVLLDALGRNVLELEPGAIDIRGLAPGVYFVHLASENKTRSVVIVK